MGKVASSMSMSLDGFITGPHDSREHQLGIGGEPLHAWLGEAGTQADRNLLREMVDNCGAVVMGRRSYDHCVGDGGWGDGGPVGQTPCFVLTHRPPTEAPPVFTFVTDGITRAIAQAQAAAGDRVVGLHGASAPQQALTAGLLDEIQLHLAPLLLGDGVPLFDLLGAGPIVLTRTNVIVSDSGFTHLRYQVDKPNRGR